MARQIAIALLGSDEQLFLDFLRSTADISLFESFAPTREELWVEKMAPQLTGHWQYRAWNRDFPWAPEYGTVGDKAHDPSMIGWSYVSNASFAPVLEIDRFNPDELGAGRLFWAGRRLSGATYDEEAFEDWVKTSFRWVRKNGKKLEIRPGEKGVLAPYVFPEAEALILARRQNGPA